MSTVIRRGSARFVERAAGRETRHTFSFGSSYDPERLAFGPMVCHDEHLLRAGAGFEPHRHAGLEIITYVVDGALTHTDESGSVRLETGQLAVLSTGSGVEHSEIAAATPTRFVQVWLTSDRDGEPTYAVHEGGVTLPGARLAIHHLDAGVEFEIASAPLQHVYVARGALLRGSLAEPLQAGDAYELRETPAITVTTGVPTTLLVWSFD